MTDILYEYPQPVRSPENSVYLDGWRAGQLMIQQCTECHNYVFFPRPICPHCWCDNLGWVESEGRGEIVSYSIIYRPNHPSFNDEVPISLAEIKLDEGVSLLARIVAGEAKSNARVVVENSPGSCKRYPLPVFKVVE